MKFITFLKLDNTVYISTNPSDSTDIPVPDKPNYECVFDRDSYLWIISKDHLKKMIKEYKNNKISEGLIWKDKLISIDDKAIEHMTSIKSSGTIFKTFNTIQWKTKDDDYLELDKKSFLEMYDKVLETIQYYFLIEKRKKDIVLQLSNEELLLWLQDENNLISGWPDQYGVIIMENNDGDSSTM